ncbi:MAG: hypothetical protein DWG76_00980 [Chloroflexi bacterium]|nr:hypothetical protein [Chloroflexota bacterium]MQC26010.1 hypothetical protein [Chloroflexota bacterium]
MDRESLRRFATPGVLFSALGIGGALIVAGALWLFWFAPQGALSEAPESALTIIPGPSSTTLPPTATLIPTSTVTPTFAPLAPGEFGLGSYVQITGTQGDGLNIRTQPGLSTGVNFLGYDAEVFEVRDGPMEADGFTWWYLVTPVDEARNGWAASAYLSVVANP